jgi:hypothetical protein
MQVKFNSVIARRALLDQAIPTLNWRLLRVEEPRPRNDKKANGEL